MVVVATWVGEMQSGKVVGYLNQPQGNATASVEWQALPGAMVGTLTNLDLILTEKASNGVVTLSSNWQMCHVRE